MSRRPSVLAVSRRPAGPRCHGGASSLLRLGAAVVAPRAAPAAAGGWNDLDDASAVEHVVRRPLCAPGAVFWS